MSCFKTLQQISLSKKSGDMEGWRGRSLSANTDAPTTK